MDPKKTLKKHPAFHGWYILASSFAILLVVSGARYSFGIMFGPMVAEFGWNRASISLAFFLNSTLFALSLVLVGRFYDRFGAKWVILITAGEPGVQIPSTK